MKKTKTAHKPEVKVTVMTKLLGKAPETKSFVLQDGRKLRNVLELIDELETMSEETFRHYVTETENHFANWIEHVFGEKELAGELRHITNKTDSQRAVLKKLVRHLLTAKK